MNYSCAISPLTELVPVEVFKTNVQNKLQGQWLIKILAGYLPDCRINFDLEDCDRILRVEGFEIDVEKVIQILQDNLCECSVLP